jgi:hypothetical protein
MPISLLFYRQWDQDLFVRQFCGVCQCCTDILVSQLRIRFTDLGHRHTIGQAPYDQRHRDPCSLDARFTMVRVRRDHNSLLQATHCISTASLTYSGLSRVHFF